ncbi:TylF/MycF/NovP-related O-methyltransferase [Paremcibacter congregatus]|uniref:dTDP-6-deoxy-L-hexose 3-O-methyltransferase n=1 Tax=Paremcibacter congregatus TaxID=2043170 RepID=A0A2G4YR63_9PROT|nr:TylF/MycF/NovP-related O-methyltransferase [Paremcibacter congregatus]PHZ84812.1 dTDP-6-deoxy-L-hexose 3-O-methyltransferase [Paremcibacter congregatus]QDE26214.1 dTDP-6-deoxy-L-hexose 3-O-methyltransferase [Paremcibacter congregatus]
MLYDINRNFEYENGFYATAEPRRLSKFISHLEFFKQTAHLRGEILELGVFKGNSLFRWLKFRDLLENTYSRKVIAFDIFGAFPETEFEEDKKERDLFIAETDGGVGISYEELTALLQAQNLDKNTEIIKGDILKTLPAYLKENPQLKLSVLHIDVDLYEATQASLDLLYDRVVKGGVIIFDDYGDFAGANKAIDDFFDGGVEIKKLPYANAVAYVVK